MLVKGTISEVGTYDELISHNGAFADFIETYLTERGEDNDPDSEGNVKVKHGFLKLKLI